jgi:hypothetical protein
VTNSNLGVGSFLKRTRHTQMDVTQGLSPERSELEMHSVSSSQLQSVSKNGNEGTDNEDDSFSAAGLSRSQSHIANIFHASSETSSPLKKGDSTFSNRTKDFRLNLKGKEAPRSLLRFTYWIRLPLPSLTHSGSNITGVKSWVSS